MLTAPSAVLLEIELVTVLLLDDDGTFAVLSIQEPLHQEGAKLMMELLQQGAAGRAAGHGA